KHRRIGPAQSIAPGSCAIRFWLATLSEGLETSGSRGQLGALGLFWSHLKHIGHSAEFGKRTGLHLPHQVGAMHFHRGFGDADIVGNLFVEATSRDQDHDFPLAGAERVETLPELTQSPIALATGTIASEAGFDSLEEVLITERLCEELYGTPLHRLYGHRNVAVRRDEDDRQLPVRRGKVALKLKTASPRHSNVEHQASGAVWRGSIEKSD